jgi:outer membrane protein
MKRAIGLALMVMAAGSVSTAAQADEGSWLVRARAVRLHMADQSEAIPSLGVPSDAIQANDKTIPEIDITYFFTKNIAAELILTVPQKQDVTLSGAKIGTFKHLPPTLTVQYHFLPDGMVRPYVGAGVNYTRISSVALNVPGVGDLDLESSSLGGALQVGVDVKVADNLFVNLDVKKVWISSDVMLKSTGAKVSSVTLDPIAFSVGIGYRF